MSIDNVKKSKSMGRPPVDTEAVTVRLPREMLEAIDDYRRTPESLPTRPEALRILLKDQLYVLAYLNE